MPGPEDTPSLDQAPAAEARDAFAQPMPDYVDPNDPDVATADRPAQPREELSTDEREMLERGDWKKAQDYIAANKSKGATDRTVIPSQQMAETMFHAAYPHEKAVAAAKDLIAEKSDQMVKNADTLSPQDVAAIKTEIADKQKEITNERNLSDTAQQNAKNTYNDGMKLLDTYDPNRTSSIKPETAEAEAPAQPAAPVADETPNP